MLTKLFTVQETAEALHIKPATVRAMLLQRRLSYFKVGRAVRISAEEVERVLREGLRAAKGPMTGGAKCE
jgi:excisionase family DNA binding protein